MRQKNPALDKVAARLVLAGAEVRAPILSGLYGKFTFPLYAGESMKRVWVTSENSFSNVLSFTQADNEAVVSPIIFGTDTDTGSICKVIQPFNINHILVTF